MGGGRDRVHGGIGEHSALIRHRCLQRLGFLGAVLAEDLNRAAHVDLKTPCIDISATHSSTRLLVVRADEEGSMVRQAAALFALPGTAQQALVPIAVSARHAHLSQATIERLFGAGYRLPVPPCRRPDSIRRRRPSRCEGRAATRA
jgi:acetate kinase